MFTLSPKSIKKNFSLHALVFFLLLFSHSADAATITGKVIGVSDGDTITVLQDHTQYKIRLYGIDTPERCQDFGTQAKQFTSGLVFGKVVTIIQKDVDRYGRVVGLVYVGVSCVNKQIIKMVTPGFTGNTVMKHSAGIG